MLTFLFYRRVFFEKIRLVFVPLLLLIGYSEQALSRETVKVSLSSYASEGDYGFQSKTFTLATQAGIKYQNDQWSFRFTQPYVYQDGPAQFAYLEQGESGEIFTVIEEEQQTRSGLADPSLSFSYRWPKKSRTGYWSISERWKIPRADEAEGFSSGRN